MQQYNIDHFINKFESIPEEKWITGHYGYKGSGEHCALGHCYDAKTNSYFGEEAQALWDLFGNPMRINDGAHPEYLQPTPKQRVLAALFDIKAQSAVKEAQEIVNTEQEVLV